MKRVVFDTDIGIDDAMALLFLHAEPSVHIEAITTVAGNASLDNVTRNALHVCERFAIDAPVFRGANGPVGPALTRDYADFVHGANGLGEIDFPEPERCAEKEYAADAIVRLAQRYPGELSLVAVGRLSNVAQALQRCPELPELIGQLVVMGGVFFRRDHVGNVSPVAEANIAGDPQAADLVFGSGIATRIVGLDVTQETIMDEAFIDELRRRAGKAGDFIHAITRFYFDFYSGLSGERACPIHDSSAVACLLAPQLYVHERAPVRVVTEGIAMGQTIPGPQPERYATDAWADRPCCEVGVEVDAAAVKALYLDTLSAAFGGQPPL
ncbi:MAG: nucleoside hydrolase [Halieaceae bacterium]|jgi:inosine-uridine nucleoside N-ribohydrolase|nr:nucleoside hydrolase [Halieaceae bacterium]